MPSFRHTPAHARPSQLLLPSLSHLLFHLVLLPFLLATLLVHPSTPSSLCAAQSASNVTYSALANDQPVSGALTASATAYYFLTLPAVAYQQTALISVAASVGSPLLYVSFTNSPVPSASSYSYSASWQTGGVVAIRQQQSPYTVYVAVQASAYSACNYTLVATVYDSAAAQSTAIPLSSAVPLASAIAAGEYRYYTYNVSEGTDVVTVALTETYGQCYLLIDSPEYPVPPTLDYYDFVSGSLSFPLVALLQPAAGVWRIGVWSNQSAAFAIIAADNTDTQPMELGVSYPGYVETKSFTYYSIYIDALQLAAYNGYLDLELYSVSGDADLYCSNTTTQPNETDSRWFSGVDAIDRILISSRELSAGTIYCGVQGYDTASYIISASYGSAFTLSAGEPARAESLTGGSQLYSFVFPAVDALITLSVVSEVGQTELFLNPYGQPPSYFEALITATASSQQLQHLYTSNFCGFNNSLAIPGSSPLLCQMQVLVTTSSLAIYDITASTTGEIVQLVGGEIVEGAVSPGQPAWYSFYIEDELSNITLAITVTNGASDLTLSIGLRDARPGFNGFNLFRARSLQPFSDAIVYTLSYSDPLLPYYKGELKGEFLAILSTNTQNVSFSAVYTISNDSVYGSSILELLDGVPQVGLLDSNAYNFFYFRPPLASWPYSVTITVVNAYGPLRVVASDVPRIAPLATDAALVSGTREILLTPDLPGICNPTINATCGYSISLQGFRVGGQSEYTITVTTGHWLRDIYPNSAPQLSSVRLNDSDWWQTSVTLASSLHPQMVYALIVTSGSVTVYASNMTPEPNSTTAQLIVANVSGTAVIAVPMMIRFYPNTLVYLTVSCVFNNSAACEYTLQAQSYDDRVSVSTLSFSDASQPVTVLLPAGKIKWLAYEMAGNSTLKYLILQAEVAVGTPSLYAKCINYQPGQTLLPNETYNTWQAVSAPLAIELFRFNASAASCPYLVLGVRASGIQGALLDVSVTTAGQVQELGSSAYGTGSAVGVSTAASPVSYWSYTLTDSDASTVLEFTLVSDGSTCVNQLQLAVGDTTPFPNASDPSTYSFRRSAVELPNGLTDKTLAITNFSRPVGSLHAGYYYVAVSGAANTTCPYVLQGAVTQQRQLPLGQLAAYGLLNGAASYFTLAPVPYNTSASLAVQLPGNTGVVALYVAVDNTPSPADPSTYLLSAVYDSTQAGTSGMYVAQPVYVPASACASPATVGQACTVVVMAVSSVTSQSVYLQAMSSANAVQLLPNVSVTTPAFATSLTATYQLSLPASPLSVVLTFTTSSPLTVWCSYQYVTPDARFNEWQWQVSDGSSAANSSGSQVSFAWGNTTAAGIPLQLTNPTTQLATPPTTCYCTVQASSFTPYSLFYTTGPASPAVPPARTPSSSSTSTPNPTAPAPSSSSSFSATPTSTLSSTPSSTSTPASTSTPTPTSTPLPAPPAEKSGGLSGGALAAAVAVPVVVVFLLTALLLLWVRRRGGVLWCCHDLLGKDRSVRDTQEPETDSGPRDVPMQEISRNQLSVQDRRLISLGHHSEVEAEAEYIE